VVQTVDPELIKNQFMEAMEEVRRKQEVDLKDRQAQACKIRVATVEHLLKVFAQQGALTQEQTAKIEQMVNDVAPKQGSNEEELSDDSVSRKLNEIFIGIGQAIQDNNRKSEAKIQELQANIAQLQADLKLVPYQSKALAEFEEFQKRQEGVLTEIKATLLPKADKYEVLLI
jgi:polyhydroxyalkanoate synthesis regulator phasin